MRNRFEALFGSAVLALTPIFAAQELRLGTIAFPSGDQELVIAIDETNGEDELIGDDYGLFFLSGDDDDEGQGEPVVTAESDAALEPEAASRTVVVQDIESDDDSVSGTVANRSSRAVGDVRLLVRQSWQWNDERDPESDAPARTITYVLSEPVAAHDTRAFRIGVPPPPRDDGHFVTRVVVGSFTEIGL